MALLSPEGYVRANRRTRRCWPPSRTSEDGGLDGAFLLQPHLRAKKTPTSTKNSGSFSIENIEGKSFSFVSATSTSGFKVPSSGIVTEFGLYSSDELLEGGKFFSEVLFGNSHVGSLVNLLSGDADAAAFDDVDVDMYLDLVSGEANRQRRGVLEPRRRGLRGSRCAAKEFTIIHPRC